MEVTTVQLPVGTRNKLASFKEYPRETYAEIIEKLMAIASRVMEEGELSEEALADIRQAKKETAKGKGISTRELLKRLGA